MLWAPGVIREVERSRPAQEACLPGPPSCMLHLHSPTQTPVGSSGLPPLLSPLLPPGHLTNPSAAKPPSLCPGPNLAYAFSWVHSPRHLSPHGCFLPQPPHGSEGSLQWHIQVTLCLGIILELSLLSTAHLSARGGLCRQCLHLLLSTCCPNGGAHTEHPGGGEHSSVGSEGGQGASTTYELCNPEQDARPPAFPSVITFSL